MAKAGDTVRCALPDCAATFVLRRGKEHQKYHTRKCRYKAWFRRKYVERKNA